MTKPHIFNYFSEKIIITLINQIKSSSHKDGQTRRFTLSTGAQTRKLWLPIPGPPGKPFPVTRPLWLAGTTPFLPLQPRTVRTGPPLRGPAPISSELLSLLPSLQLIVGSTAGMDHVDLAECRRRHVTVTNAGAAFSDDVADYAVGLLIDVLRRVSAAERYVRFGLWPQNGEYPLGTKVRSRVSNGKCLTLFTLRLIFASFVH